MWQLALAQYKRVLAIDASNVEAIACLAPNHFYSDQPELALRYYRGPPKGCPWDPIHPHRFPSACWTPAGSAGRLLQMGVSTPELWNNLGLCCFYASQYAIVPSPWTSNAPRF